MKVRTTFYRITCPYCKGKSVIPDWEPRYCAHCDADIGGSTENRLQAEEVVYTMTIHPLTEEATVYWE